MALKLFNPGLAVFGLVLSVVLVIAALVLRKRKPRRTGIRAANTARFRALPVYRRKRLESVIFRAALAAGLIVTVAASLLLAARPYKRDTVKEDAARRDIFLCMDLSSSSANGVSKLVEEVRGLVQDLDGDQIGISLFNTSSVQYVPVTDDYDFMLQRLDELEEYFRAEEEFAEKYADKYEYVHEIPEAERARYEELNVILSAFDKGTTAGYELKGTSAVGEGLASCLFSFPELYDEERTRIILFVTDNEPAVIGTPLVTLEDAAAMCAEDSVKVFGIYPGTKDGGENSGSTDPERAKAEMKEAVEATGGAFFDYASSGSAREILEEIRGLAQTETKTVVATKDTDTPELWRYFLLGGVVLTALCLIFLIIKSGAGYFKAWRTRKKIIAVAAAALTAACTVLIFVRPMRLDANADIRTNNLDVCFVVDTTISMWAEDYDGQAKRFEGVREDIASIMDALPGSSFSLIRFDNGSEILTPYTQNITAVTDCLDTISLPVYATAEGSSLNTAYGALEAMIKASEERPGTRKTIVFLFSDGEITDGSELMSFKELAGGVDDGAVLGFGTEKGGRMNYPGRGYIQNPSTGKDARSVIDEGSLEAIAKDLGLNYLHRTQKGSSKLSQILNRIRLLSRDTALRSGDRTGWEETYHYFAGILALVMMACLFRHFRRGNVL
ncbi:MAG: VWA domain-containing protein [Lachnospiraceae bacterium]|nr:VWA domain-containing protein [Lachnospiraceae bacterium]